MSFRVIATAGLALGLAGCASVSDETACDRDCLIGVADAYLAALAAGDPDGAPLADDVRFVENVTPMEPGDGLWSSATGQTDFRIVVPDPVSGQVGGIAILKRGDVPVLLAVRLALEGGRIVQAEHLVSDVPPEANLASLVRPRPALVAVVPEAERMSRDDLIAIGGRYYDALVAADGSLAPFAADCQREENGMITAGLGVVPAEDAGENAPPPTAMDCAGQLSSKRFAYIDSIDNRRLIADPVQGLVMGLSHFRQGMDGGPFEVTTADGSKIMWEDMRDAYDLPAAHIFKIADGEIHEVEAVGIFVPYMSPTGWE